MFNKLVDMIHEKKMDDFQRTLEFEIYNEEMDSFINDAFDIFLEMDNILLEDMNIDIESIPEELDELDVPLIDEMCALLSAEDVEEYYRIINEADEDESRFEADDDMRTFFEKFI